MFAVMQRVLESEVIVEQESIAKISQGLLVFIGIEKSDTTSQSDKMIHKLLNYRIFADSEDKMNLNVQDINGELLLVPQFTLAANTRKGLRPSFSSCEIPQKAEEKFHQLIDNIKQLYPSIQIGQFGADMKISLINDGPVTFSFHIP